MMQTFNNTISVADPVEGPGGPGHPLFFDQNEAPRAEKSLWRTGPPPLSQGLCDRPPPPPSVDPSLHILTRCIPWLRRFQVLETSATASKSPIRHYTLRGGGGRRINKILYGRLRPEVQPFPFDILFLTEKVPLSNTFYWQVVSLSHTYLRKLHPSSSCVNTPSYQYVL